MAVKFLDVSRNLQPRLGQPVTPAARRLVRCCKRWGSTKRQAGAQSDSVWVEKRHSRKSTKWLSYWLTSCGKESEVVDSKMHWDSVYTNKAIDSVGWYKPEFDISMDLIAKAF